MLASSVVAFGVVFLALPSSERMFQDEVRPCYTRAERTVAPVRDERERLNLRMKLVNRCARPYFASEARWVGSGLLVESAVAGVLYGLHPWWPTLRWSRARPRDGKGRGRRTRLRLGGPVTTRLRPEDAADVVAELDALAREADPNRTPAWLVDARAPTVGGSAYGLPGRPRVRLDMGLVLRRHEDPEGYLAVVRHELAHHHNRDVGRTYLTIAIWWAFVLTALMPFVVLTLCPHALQSTGGPVELGALGAPGKLAHRLGALAVLGLTVYLARNAILRTRELHADATAHAWDTAGEALPDMVRTLPWPTRREAWRLCLARVGRHPSPARRVEAMTRPDLLLRTGVWEMAGLGLVAGLALDNLTLLVGNLSEEYLTVGLTLLALPVGALLAGSLAGAVERGAAVGSGTNRLRHLLPPATALAAGFGCSRVVSLVAADLTVFGPSTGQFALSTAILAVGLLLLAVWVDSVVRHHRGADDPAAEHGRPRRAGRAVTLAAIVVWAPPLAMWHTFALNPGDFTTLYLRPFAASGHGIAWYERLGEWTGDVYFYLPLAMLGSTPVVPLGLVLLVAVPAVLVPRLRAGTGTDVIRAVRVGAAAGCAAVLTATVLPFAARAALPSEVRNPSGPVLDLPGGLAFTGVYTYTYMLAVAFLQAAAAAVTAGTGRRLRPVLVPVAVAVTAVLGGVGLYVGRGVSACVRLTGGPPHSCSWAPFVPDADAGLRLQELVTWGAVASVAAGLIGTAVAELTGRRRADDRARSSGKALRPHRWGAVTVGALAALGTLIACAAAAALPQDYAVWKPAAATDAPQPAHEPGGAGGSFVPAVDRCLIGSWHVTAWLRTLRVGSSTAHVRGTGQIITFRTDGTTTFDNGRRAVSRGALGGHSLEVTLTGATTARYRARGHTISYSGGAVVRPGSATLLIDGVRRARQEVTPTFVPDHYTCAGDTLRLTPAEAADAGNYDITLRRGTGAGA
ncbi:M48 family metalloprotease [Streptomyces sp. NPDC059168]|uniref:M48 family metalloprotease n=1 Tax=Streptomyces sp. NPDC059168 TaxID=3346753 RepID=UPI00369A8739